MITAIQLDLYILLYDIINRDFNIISEDDDKLRIPSTKILDGNDNIKRLLDSIADRVIIDCEVKYRLLNNIIINDVLHCVYFCVIPNNTNLHTNVYKIPVKDYAIHSPNVQQIMQLIQ